MVISPKAYTATLNWKAVCGESRTHGLERAVEGQPSTATLRLTQDSNLTGGICCINPNLTKAVFCQVHQTGLLGSSLKKEADETMFLELTLRCYDHSRLRDDAPTPRTNQRYIHLSIVFYSAMDFFIDAPLRWVPVIQAIGVDSIPLLDFVSSMWSIEFWKLNTRIFVHFAE